MNFNEVNLSVITPLEAYHESSDNMRARIRAYYDAVDVLRRYIVTAVQKEDNHD